MIDNQTNIFKVIELNIKAMAKDKGINLNELISEIDMTEGGFYKMLTSETIKVKTLKKIADVLELPIQFFFEGSSSTIQKQKGGKYNSQVMHSIVSEPAGEYQKIELEGLKKQVQQLESQIIDKDNLIALYKEKIK